MKIAVCVKEVLDARLPVRVSADRIVGTGSDFVSLINPADRAALEVALRLKIENPGTRVEAFGVCEPGRDGALRFALARGVDAVQRIPPDEAGFGPPATALRLAARLSRETYDLVCCGDETLDNASGVVGPLLAEILDLALAASACRLGGCAQGKLSLERKLGRGWRDRVEVDLPAVVCWTEDAGEAVYVSSSRLDKSRRAQIPAWEADGVDAAKPVPIWPAAEKKEKARARVKTKAAPNPGLSAADRMKMMMVGGMKTPKPSKESSIVQGDPEHVAEQLFRFFKHHGFI
jgi:electron transfer flavoprotein beta subunit